jgi:pyruvate-ferredoxin/flavodoxin oxidoreductase
VPFLYATDEDQRLIKVQCSASIVALVKDRRRYWQVLQYLSGVHEAKLTSLHKSDLADLQARYEQAMRDRETSIDDIANAMSSLATSSRAPVGPASAAPVRSGGPGVQSTASGMPDAPAGAAPSPGGLGTVGAVGTAPPDAPIYLAEVDLPKCNDCGTCYQELPQLFEPHSMVIDGAVQKVARMVPGALESVEMTPEILKRADRVKKTCDAEIIQ